MSERSDPTRDPAAPFDPARFVAMLGPGHGGRLGLGYGAHGADWAELTLPYDPALAGDAQGGLATGPIVTLLDVASAVGVWLRLGHFRAHATLDLRIDHLRTPVPGRTIVGRGECYRIAGNVAFVRGSAHDGDAGGPVAHMTGTFFAPEGYR